jgi:hypothetical protein
MALADLFDHGAPDRGGIAKLLTAIRNTTKPVKPPDLGIIGKEHLAARFKDAGADLETFNYRRTLRGDDGGRDGGCVRLPPEWSTRSAHYRRSELVGRHQQPVPNSLVHTARASTRTCKSSRAEPIILVVHLVSPRIAYTDRGKSAVALRGEIDESEVDSDYDEELDQ